MIEREQLEKLDVLFHRLECFDIQNRPLDAEERTILRAAMKEYLLHLKSILEILMSRAETATIEYMKRIYFPAGYPLWDGSVYSQDFVTLVRSFFGGSEVRSGGFHAYAYRTIRAFDVEPVPVADLSPYLYARCQQVLNNILFEIDRAGGEIVYRPILDSMDYDPRPVPEPGPLPPFRPTEE